MKLALEHDYIVQEEMTKNTDVHHETLSVRLWRQQKNGEKTKKLSALKPLLESTTFPALMRDFVFDDQKNEIDLLIAKDVTTDILTAGYTMKDIDNAIANDTYLSRCTIDSDHGVMIWRYSKKSDIAKPDYNKLTAKCWGVCFFWVVAVVLAACFVIISSAVCSFIQWDGLTTFAGWLGFFCCFGSLFGIPTLVCCFVDRLLVFDIDTVKNLPRVEYLNV